jgi:hypothetical protein
LAYFGRSDINKTDLFLYDYMTVILEKRQTDFPFSMSNGITLLCMVLFITLVDVLLQLVRRNGLTVHNYLVTDMFSQNLKQFI